MGEDLGGAVKGFKKGMHDANSENEQDKKPEAVTQKTEDNDTIDVQAKEKKDA